MKNILSVNFRLARPEAYPGKGDKYLPKIIQDLSNLPLGSGNKTFFDQPIEFGWDVKKKLIWLGKHSYTIWIFYFAGIRDIFIENDIQLFHL